MSEPAAPEIPWQTVIDTLLDVAQVPADSRTSTDALVACLVPMHAQERRMLETVCRLEQVLGADEVLVGAHLLTLVQTLKDQADALRVRALERARPTPTLPQVEEIPLALAGEVFYRHLYPLVQEQWEIGMEQTGESFAALLLGVANRFAASVQEADMNDVPDAVRRGSHGLPHAPAPRASGGGVPASALLPDGMQSLCECCGDGIEIPAGSRKNRLAYHPECGAFRYATQTYAGNVARTPTMEDRPWPDPYEHRIPQARWERVKGWQAGAMPQFLEQARKKVREFPGAA